MKQHLARYWALYSVALSGPALTGCADDTSTTTATMTDASTSTTAGPTSTSVTDGSVTDTTTGVPTTGTPTTGSTSDATTAPGSTTDATTSGSTTDASTSGTSTGMVSGSSSGSSTGEAPCMTILCGQPAVCCADMEECVDAKCLPECPSGIRCGADKSICCGAGQVCLGDKCEMPLGPCKDSYDCDPGNYCEPVFKQCLPQPDPLDCEVKPDIQNIDVQLEWAWTADDVVITPIVADVDGDNSPDVVVTTIHTNGPTSFDGEIVLIDGKTGTEKWRIKHDPPNNKYGSMGSASVAVGDVSGDGKPDIIYAGRHDLNNNVNLRVGPVHAVDGTGKLLWTAHLPGQNTPVNLNIVYGTATVVNLDSDPQAEIAFGAALIDHDGTVVWNQGNNGARYGTPLNNNNPIYTGGVATFADLDGDSKPELVTGRDAWKINWIPGNPPVVTMTQFWKNLDGPMGMQNGNDGWPSIADLDGNGTPEVVLTAWPYIRVIDGKTGKLWCGVDPTGVACQNNDSMRTQPIAIKGGNLGGPATIADFDGDGRPEAGIAGGVAYAVYDFNRMGEMVVKPAGDPVPAAGAMYARWVSSATQDNSSACTGSSVFDFQGDGAAEVAYQDECNAYVYDGATGAIQLKIVNSSGTAHEYPLVADVDGDGNSEFIVVANNPGAAAITSCQQKNPMWTVRKGVFLYGAAGDNWVPTRKVWTQHTYHVTNAESSGNPPMSEMSNWLDPNLNNFRQNVQGEGVFNAPDLTISLAADLNKCSGELVLVATIYNEGAQGVAKGIDVTFYEGVDATGTKLGTKPTTQDILPGASTMVTWNVPGPNEMNKKNFYAEVDPGMNGGMVNECKEMNNGAIVTEAFCPNPG